ncbi:MAG: hypothetical protein D6797_01900 [Bdellovibrio sp.]|nr:MAG: hypothetical protein D6797_01900 [Bdellovibrio sp.]
MQFADFLGVIGSEGFNRKAKLIQRMACGYRSHRNYRLRALYSCR